MNKTGLIVTSWEEPGFSQGRSVGIGIKHPGNRLSIIKGPLTFTLLEDGDMAMVYPPAIDGLHGREFLQAALDHAWSIGMRPLNYRQESTEQVAAMSAHLADMRSLVFKGKLEPKP